MSLETPRSSFFFHLDTISEDSVGQEECVEEVDREESEVSQPLKESLRRGVANLWHLTVIQSSAKPKKNGEENCDEPTLV